MNGPHLRDYRLRIWNAASHTQARVIRQAAFAYAKFGWGIGRRARNAQVSVIPYLRSIK